MQQECIPRPTFTRERAFVIQFHRDADLQAGRFEGRVEHVISGRFSHFQRVHELEAFIRTVLDTPTGEASIAQGAEP